MLIFMQATSDSLADTRWQILNARRLEVKTAEAFLYLRDRGIEPILIKGWAAARNYPPNEPRFYDDIDLAVSTDDFDTAREHLATGIGPQLDVDLHRELRHLDTKPWASILADSQSVELDGRFIRIPSAEDHLRILAVHWLNDGAERKERLWDIYYAVATRPDDFDWNKCLGEVSERRRGWVLAAVGLAHRYLGLPIDGIPFKSEIEDLPPWLVKTVEREWRSGVRTVRLASCLHSPSEFFRQIRKRFPPNPIQATIDMEGDFRSRRTRFYQLGSMKKRCRPSIERLAATVKLRFK